MQKARTQNLLTVNHDGIAVSAPGNGILPVLCLNSYQRNSKMSDFVVPKSKAPTCSYRVILQRYRKVSRIYSLFCRRYKLAVALQSRSSIEALISLFYDLAHTGCGNTCHAAKYDVITNKLTASNIICSLQRPILESGHEKDNF